MSSLPKPYYTPEQYLDRERQADYKSEYFAGEIFAMAGASRTHNLISGNVSASLTAQLRDRPCEVYANDMRVQADQSRQYSYPDVVVVCGEPQFRDGREDTLTNPLVIVEVLSPSTEANDRGEKFMRYRRVASLTDYVLMSQNARHIEHFVKQPDGSWRMTEANGPEGNILLSSIGCVLPLADAYNKVTLETPVRLVLDEPR
jgi:Uma2 family endonuclease